MIRASLAIVLALVAAATIGALSRIPWQAGPNDRALLRLAWRAGGERLETCRRLTAAELEKIPVHMRRETVCTEREIPYRLELEVNGTRLADDLVHAAGVRRDRPLYVLREFPLTPGEQHLSVRFFRTEEPPAGETEVGETPAKLKLDSTVTLAAGEILLITYDPEVRRLVIERPQAIPGSTLK